MRYLLVSVLYFCCFLIPVSGSEQIEKIKMIEERITKINNIISKADVIIKNNDKEIGLSGILIADSQDNTRIRFNYGEHVIIDYIKTKELFSLLLPRKDALFVGQVGTVGKADNLIKLMNNNLSGKSVV